MSDAFLTQLQSSLGPSYVIRRELGRGGMSRVFLAEETALRREVVMKVLMPRLTEGMSGGRFSREIRVASRLQHPNIVPMHTAGDANGLPYYTMPYVRGESLRARLGAGPIPLADAIDILRDVARALAYAHGQGVVHRDIKPENILLGDGAAVVADFGIAKAISVARAEGGDVVRRLSIDTLTQPGTSLGTPAYMAPEQALGDDVDHRTDLYTWGVVAYEILAGRHPFAGKPSGQAVIAAHVTEVPTPLWIVAPHVPRALATLVMSCIEKEPPRRPESAEAIARALGAFEVATAEFVARQRGGVDTGARATVPRRFDRRLVVGVAVASVFVGVLIVLWMRGVAG
jgi:serine/threonine-protein kinase